MRPLHLVRSLGILLRAPLLYVSLYLTSAPEVTLRACLIRHLWFVTPLQIIIKFLSNVS